MSNRNERACAAIICNDGKVLACKRATDPDANGWEFPRGELGPGDDSLICCKHMIAEQLGCRISTIWKLEQIDYNSTTYHLSTDCYVCALVPQEDLVLRGYDQMRWLGYNELLDVEWLPESAQIVRLVGMYWDQLFFAEHL